MPRKQLQRYPQHPHSTATMSSAAAAVESTKQALLAALTTCLDISPSELTTFLGHQLPVSNLLLMKRGQPQTQQQVLMAAAVVHPPAQKPVDYTNPYYLTLLVVFLLIQISVVVGSQFQKAMWHSKVSFAALSADSTSVGSMTSMSSAADSSVAHAKAKEA
jgi:hypothetical protein